MFDGIIVSALKSTECRSKKKTKSFKIKFFSGKLKLVWKKHTQRHTHARTHRHARTHTHTHTRPHRYKYIQREREWVLFWRNSSSKGSIKPTCSVFQGQSFQIGQGIFSFSKLTWLLFGMTIVPLSYKATDPKLKLNIFLLSLSKCHKVHFYFSDAQKLGNGKFFNYSIADTVISLINVG